MCCILNENIYEPVEQINFKGHKKHVPDNFIEKKFTIVLKFILHKKYIYNKKSIFYFIYSNEVSVGKFSVK